MADELSQPSPLDVIAEMYRRKSDPQTYVDIMRSLWTLPQRALEAGRQGYEEQTFNPAGMETAMTAAGGRSPFAAASTGELGSAGGALARGGPMGAAKIPHELYHVVPANADISQGLKSLYQQHGNQAYEMFAKRWPDAGNLGEYHAHNIMFYDNLEAAASHAAEFGGKILRVDPAKIRDALTFDGLEGGGFWATSEPVPREAFSEVPR